MRMYKFGYVYAYAYNYSWILVILVLIRDFSNIIFAMCDERIHSIRTRARFSNTQIK